jgi:hypothetical protein
MTTGGVWTRLQRHLPRFLQVPTLTRGRIVGAFAVAVVADGVQFALGPLGWSMADEVLDVAAMVVITWLLGFHPLLLPTFLIEMFPVADALPTWTGCVALVVGLRRREQRPARLEDRTTSDDRPVGGAF